MVCWGSQLSLAFHFVCVLGKGGGFANKMEDKQVKLPLFWVCLVAGCLAVCSTIIFCWRGAILKTDFCSQEGVKPPSFWVKIIWEPQKSDSRHCGSDNINVPLDAVALLRRASDCVPKHDCGTPRVHLELTFE